MLSSYILRGGLLFGCKVSGSWIQVILVCSLLFVNAMVVHFVLQAMSPQDRRKILLDIADAVEANENLITVENEADVAAAQQAGYEKALIARLALKPAKARFCYNNFFCYILFFRFYVEFFWRKGQAFPKPTHRLSFT